MSWASIPRVKSYLAGFLVAGGSQLCTAAPQPDYYSVFNRPALELGPAIARRFGCRWSGNPVFGSCVFDRGGLTADFHIDPISGTAQSIEIRQAIEDPITNQKRRAGSDVIVRLVEYLLPAWPRRSEWPALAMREAWDHQAEMSIRFAYVNVITEFRRSPDKPLSTVYFTIRMGDY
jgi:hypothetical protein